jgi:hypothetical protein
MITNETEDQQLKKIIPCTEIKNCKVILKHLLDGWTPSEKGT